MSAIGLGPGNCTTKNSQLGQDGRCYDFCEDGWAPIDNGPFCAQKCPKGFAPTTTVDGQACVRPAFNREIKPFLQCPEGSDRMYDKCLLACPPGTTNNFNLCLPDCPPGYVDTEDKLSCQAEFYKRSATVREACYANETRIGGRYCLGPCDAGTVASEANSEMCYATLPASVAQYFWTGNSTLAEKSGPIVSKLIFARTQSNAYCQDGFVPLNGSCFANCPEGSQNLSTQCVAECPVGFKTSNNQTVCVCPVKRRNVRLSTLDNIGVILRNITLGIVGIILLSFITSLA